MTRDRLQDLSLARSQPRDRSAPGNPYAETSNPYATNPYASSNPYATSNSSNSSSSYANTTRNPYASRNRSPSPRPRRSEDRGEWRAQSQSDPRSTSGRSSSSSRTRVASDRSDRDPRTQSSRGYDARGYSTRGQDSGQDARGYDSRGYDSRSRSGSASASGSGSGSGSRPDPRSRQELPRSQQVKRAAPPNDDAFWAQVPVVDRTLAKLDAAINEVEATGRDSVRNPGDARYAAAADRATAAADRQRKQCTEEVQRLKRMVSRNTHDRAITVLERYEETLGRQRKIESQINREVKDRAARQYRIVKPDATEREIEQVIRNPDQVFSQALKGSHRYNQVRRAADEVNKRHQDILKIERTLEELAQMFTEMATLVLKQDDQIVEISEVAVTVEKDIVQGTEQLEKAVVTAKSTRKKKWWCVILCVIILLAVAGALLGVFLPKVLNKS